MPGGAAKSRGRWIARAVVTGLIWAMALTGVAKAADADPDPVTSEEIRRGYRARTLLAKPRRSGADFATVEQAANLRLVRAHPALGWRVLETDGREDVRAVIDRLASSGAYEYVEPNYLRFAQVLPDDPKLASDQWSLNNTGQSGGLPGADIRAAAAWDIQHDAADVIVAVVDSGLRINHEDILTNVWTNSGESKGHASVDDDGNGYIDDLHGINAIVAKTAPFQVGTIYDDHGHGTHVAGIIGAIGNNGVGVTGVAWKVQIMPLKFLGASATGNVADAVRCIEYAVANGAKIINASYGSYSSSQAEYDAIKRAREAGVIFVAAAGNDNQEISEYPMYPAAYLLDNIVAVASTTRQDKLASYSTYGTGLVDLAAPGSSILSLGTATNQDYVVKSGTSMATPHVAGALALLRQKFPDDNYRGLINRLLNSVDILPALENRVQTNGRLNLRNALSTTVNRPYNDDFAKRPTIAGESNTLRGSNQFATLEAGEPDHGVANSSGTLWWSWTAPEGVAQAIVSTAGSEFDTVLAVYSGDTLSNLVTVARNDDVAGGTTSRASFMVTPGTKYAVAVAGKGGATGQIVLSITAIPSNDSFSAAQVLAGPSVVVAGNSANATSETGEPRPKNSRGTSLGRGYSVWYKWTAPSTRHYQISVTNEVLDPVVAVYTGTSLASLVPVASNDDADFGRYDSLVDFTATAGVTYYIWLDASTGTGGRYHLSIEDADWQGLTFLANSVSPAIAPDGTICQVDDFGAVYAFRPDGTTKWSWFGSTDYAMAGAAVVDQDGTVYFGDESGTVYAIGADGKKKWSTITGGPVWTAPALAADGTLYVKSDDGMLTALDGEGKQKWQFSAGGDTYSSPTIGSDGTIYIGSGDKSALFAVKPDGTKKWQFDLGATVYASPAIGADGTLYLGNYDGRFFAIKADGTERWHFDSKSPLSGSAALDARGYVYFGSYDKKLYALDAATGAKKWEYATGDTIRGTCPVIADDGTIYIGSDDGFVHAVNPDGTLRRTYATGGAVFAAPVLAAGRLYVPGSDAKLHAFEVGSNLAKSPWPMHRHNVRRFARAVEPLPGMPVIAAQPGATTVSAGAAATFSTTASVPGGGALTYQWRFNSQPITGATNATLTIPSAQTANAGTYSVIVTGPGGSILSTTADLAVKASVTNDSRLTNLAVRTIAGTGDRLLIVGFAVGGANTTGTKPLLIRGIGPTLSSFGVTGVMADPRIRLLSGSTELQLNDNWDGNAQVEAVGRQVGAFPLTSPTSKDAAIVTNRAADSYTVTITGADSASGVAMAEIYDATAAGAYTATTPRLVNVSARAEVRTGDGILIAGFVVTGSNSKKVMIRAIGPTLADFGVGSALMDPKLQLYSGSNLIQENDNWGMATNAAEVATVATSVGAFPLKLESKDAVLLITLPAGIYTAQLSGVKDTTGVALVELYEVAE